MNALTHSTFGGEAPTMSSREIAQLCDARHNDVVATIVRLFDQGVLRESRKTTRTVAPEGGGRPTQVYDLTKRDTLVVVSGYSAELRAKIIDRWQELEARARDPQVILSDPGSLRILLLQNVEKVIALESKVAADAPKVAFAEQVQVAPDAISIAQAAKTLGTGRNRLMQRLREMRWVTRLGEPYQDKINAGLLDVKIGSWEHPEKGLQRSVTALVTGKGLARLHREIGVTAH